MCTFRRALPNLFAAILALSFAQITCADGLLNVKQFVDLCDKSDPGIFKHKDDLQVGKSPIKVFVLAPGQKTKTPYIAVTLKRGRDMDAEIPLFEKICASDYTVIPTLDTKTGDITFKSAMNGDVSIVFRRTDAVLKRTKWKIDANDPTSGYPSVWLVGYSSGTFPPPEPKRDDWCANITKRVDISTDHRDVSFAMCPFDANTAYRYALHLEQKGDDLIPVDIGIDPQILHQP
jgi:hypothetical protein